MPEIGSRNLFSSLNTILNKKVNIKGKMENIKKQQGSGIRDLNPLAKNEIDIQSLKVSDRTNFLKNLDQVLNTFKFNTIKYKDLSAQTKAALTELTTLGVDPNSRVEEKLNLISATLHRAFNDFQPRGVYSTKAQAILRSQTYLGAQNPHHAKTLITAVDTVDRACTIHDTDFAKLYKFYQTRSAEDLSSLFKSSNKLRDYITDHIPNARHDDIHQEIARTIAENHPEAFLNPENARSGLINQGSIHFNNVEYFIKTEGARIYIIPGNENQRFLDNENLIGNQGPDGPRRTIPNSLLTMVENHNAIKIAFAATREGATQETIFNILSRCDLKNFGDKELFTVANNVPAAANQDATYAVCSRKTLEILANVLRQTSLTFSQKGLPSSNNPLDVTLNQFCLTSGTAAQQPNNNNPAVSIKCEVTGGEYNNEEFSLLFDTVDNNTIANTFRTMTNDNSFFILQKIAPEQADIEKSTELNVMNQYNEWAQPFDFDGREVKRNVDSEHLQTLEEVLSKGVTYFDRELLTNLIKIPNIRNADGTINNDTLGKVVTGLRNLQDYIALETSEIEDRINTLQNSVRDEHDEITNLTDDINEKESVTIDLHEQSMKLRESDIMLNKQITQFMQSMTLLFRTIQEIMQIESQVQ